MAELGDQKKPVVFSYDYELDQDDIDDIVKTQIDENDLDLEKHTQEIKDVIDSQVKETKLKYKKGREEQKARMDAVSEADKQSFKKMKLYKFYPQNDYPDTKECHVSYINRYYGKADEEL